MKNLQNIPLEKILSKNKELKDVKLYLGITPQKCNPPYIVWQRIGGDVANALNRHVVMASLTVQIDVYAQKIEQVRQIVAQILISIEKHAYIERFNMEIKDLTVNLYRSSFDVTFFNSVT